MSRTVQCLISLGLLYLSLGCDGQNTSSADTSADQIDEAEIDEAGSSVLEVMIGDQPKAGAETGTVAGAEVDVEAGVEAGIAAGAEAGIGAGAEAGIGAGDEAGAESGTVAGTEAGELAGADVPECEEGTTRQGETVCGLNLEGVLGQVCRNGQWLDTTECSGRDLCVNDDERQGSTQCGLNDEGTLSQLCVRGVWIDSERCSGTDICVNDEQRPGMTACGSEDRGRLIQVCREGAWIDSEECESDVPCAEEGTRQGEIICGLLGRGRLLETCAEGEWRETLSCIGDLACGSGDYLVSEERCGLNNERDEGVIVYPCADEGQWASDTYCANFSVPAEINDAPELTTEFGFFVDASPRCEIGEVSVDLDLEHAYIADLTLVLISPSGHEVTLRDRRASRIREIVGNYPQTLRIENQEAFDQLVGMPGSGLWRLKVLDTFPRDVGQVNRWSVNVACAAECEEGARALSDRPCLNEGNDTVGLISLLCEDQIFEYSESCLYPHDTPTAILDQSTITSAYPFVSDEADACFIESLSVNVDISHTYVSDLTLTLISPSEQRVVLHQRELEDQDDLRGNYPQTLTVFDREGFDALLQTEAQGLWRLEIADAADQDEGQLNSWSLDITCGASAGGALDAEVVEEVTEYLSVERLLRAPFDEQEVANIPLNQATADEVERLLWEDYRQGVLNTAQDDHDNGQVTAAGYTMRYACFEHGQKPPQGWTLYISMHGGGGTAPSVNDQQWENQKRLYDSTGQIQEGLYCAPRAPTNTWNLWHQSHIDPLLTKLIGHLIVLEDVNPNRVILMGYSAGGDGVYQLAPRMADQIAAASMSAGHPNNANPYGLRNIGFTIHMGQFDTAYNRAGVAEMWSTWLDELQAGDDLPGDAYQHDVQLHQGLGHWIQLRDAVAFNFMRPFVRSITPEVIKWHQSGVLHDRFYWLRSRNPSAGDRVLAIQNQQVFTLSPEQETELTLWLRDDQLNLDDEITVYDGNEAVVYQGPVTRTAGVIYRSMMERGDPEAVVRAQVILPSITP